MNANPEAPPPPPPRQQRSGCATAVMVIFGVVLLLPGLCAILFGAVAISERTVPPSDFFGFILMGLLAGFAGVILIRIAIRGPRR